MLEVAKLAEPHEPHERLAPTELMAETSLFASTAMSATTAMAETLSLRSVAIPKPCMIVFPASLSLSLKAPLEPNGCSFCAPCAEEREEPSGLEGSGD